MRKLLPFVIIGVLVLAGCEGLGPNTPNVTATALTDETNDGMVLRLEWTAVEDADGYKIYVDGSEVADITETSYDIDTPCKIIEVTAYNSAGESTPATIDLTPVKSEQVDVWGRSDPDPDHPSGFGFSSDGNAVTYAIGDADNYPYIDFYIDDVAFDEPNLVSPYDDNSVVNNSKGNVLAEGSASDNAAPSTGSYYSRLPLEQNGVYWLWLDPTNDGLTTDDHFVKMYVTGYDQSTGRFTFKFYYQKQGGLKWVVE